MPKIVDHAQRRAEVAEAVGRVIARSGVNGATLRDVAAEAGFSTGVLTHYFPDKAALLRFALELTTRRLADHLSAIDPKQPGSLLDTLALVLPLDEESTMNWRVWLAFWGEATADPALAETQRAHYTGFRKRIQAFIEAGQARGEFDPALDANDEADRVVALVDGIAFNAVFDPERWPPARQLDFARRHLASLAPA
jgi:AcrR family transcriptional regulator